MKNKYDSKKKDAAMLVRKNRLKEARALLVKLVKKPPPDPEVWFMLAVVNGKMGRMKDVVAACEKVTQLQPGHVGAVVNRSNALMTLGRTEEAMVGYRHALQMTPSDPVLLCNYGNALLLSGDLNGAEKLLRKSLRLNDKYLQAHFCLGKVLELLGRHESAIRRYRKTLELNPAMHEAKFRIACIRRETGSLREAEEHYRELCETSFDNPDVYAGLATTLVRLGKVSQALDVYHTMAKKYPDRESDAASGIANVYERLGDQEKAYAHIRKLIDSHKVNAKALDVFARFCWKLNACEEMQSLAADLLESGDLDDSSRQIIYFALARLLDRSGQYNKAISYCGEANHLCRLNSKSSGDMGVFERIRRVFDARTMRSAPRANNGSEVPVFVVGMPRSGTSLTEQILASHPEIVGAGELGEVSKITAMLSSAIGVEDAYPECIRSLTVNAADSLSYDYLQVLAGFSTEARRVVDKMPHNFMRLGLIALLFPGARVIRCMRSPLDNCLSIYFQNFNAAHWYSHDLSVLGKYYREYMQLMEHWKSVVDIPILDVSYEDLVANQEAVSRRIIDFCGLEWAGSCLEFHQTSRVVATASYDQVREPIYTRSLKRWKHYESHLGPLIEALGEYADNDDI